MPYILSAVIGYGLGAIPFGVIAARLRRGRDPRASGSGHTGGMNTLRSAGKMAFVLTGAGDVGKGLAAVWMVRALGYDDAAAAIASVAAVAGHCWSIYIAFKGGMGIGTFGGLTLYWLAIALPALFVAWFAVYAIVRHAPRASVLAGLTPGPLFALLGGSSAAIAFGALGGLLVSLRHVHDWNRVYLNGR
jgi:glycerol-3-phosphate acyltransferase PlsY